jgi:hypothetical protein
VREDPCHNPQDHGHASEAEEDRVQRDEAVVALGRNPAHLRGEVLGGYSWSTYRYKPEASVQRAILRVSLTVQPDLMQAVAALLNVASLQRHVASVREQVDCSSAVTKQVC